MKNSLENVGSDRQVSKAGVRRLKAKWTKELEEDLKDRTEDIFSVDEGDIIAVYNYDTTPRIVKGIKIDIPFEYEMYYDNVIRVHIFTVYTEHGQFEMNEIKGKLNGNHFPIFNPEFKDILTFDDSCLTCKHQPEWKEHYRSIPAMKGAICTKLNKNVRCKDWSTFSNVPKPSEWKLRRCYFHDKS